MWAALWVFAFRKSIRDVLWRVVAALLRYVISKRMFRQLVRECRCSTWRRMNTV